MEGRNKERVMAGAVFVLFILLSAQRLPVGVADPATSPFCQCYVCCYQGCKVNNCSDCCADCYFPGDPDFKNGCRMSGGKQAPVCGTEATGGGEYDGHRPTILVN